MYRVSADTSYNHLGDTSHVHDDLERSYSSVLSGATNGASSSSKAVLAALRALQDKIRRLEIERTQALDESAQLKQQLKNQEAEADHIKQKDNLSAQKSLQEARHAYDRLLSEKTELEIRLAKLEDRNRTSQGTSEEYQVKIRNLEDERHASAQRIKDLENQHHQLDAHIKNAQHKEKEMAETMVWETKRHEDEVNGLHKRVQTLQRELSDSCQEKGAIDSKLLELDRLVSQLLSVNESLVSQLSGKPPKAAPAPKKIKKPTKPEPFAAGADTVSSVVKASVRKSGQSVTVKNEDLESLKAMHKLYANMAKSIAASDATPARSAKKSSGVSGSGKKKTTTRVSRKKAALLEKFGEESAGASRMSEGKVNIRLPKPTNISFDANHSRLDESTDYDSDINRTSASFAPHNASASFAAPASILKHPPASGTGSVRSSHDFAEKADIKNVISALEDEFDALNLQYRRLLSNVQTPSEPHSTAGPPPAVPVVDADSIQAQAEEIVDVIQRLHKKGEQLRALKSP